MRDSSQDDALLWCMPWSLAEGEDRARAQFRRAFGTDPDTVSSAPGRVIIIGDHTDYSQGLSLPTPLPHRTFVAASARSDSKVRMTSAHSGKVEGADGVWEGDLEELKPATSSASDTGWERYVSGVLWALSERGFPARGMDIAIDSCVPIGSGLGASAALLGAVALATSECWQLMLDPDQGRLELAEATLDAERRYVGAQVGGLDQHCVLRCEQGEAVLLDFASSPPSLVHQPLYFPDYGLSLLVVDTSAPHDQRRNEYEKRRETCAKAASALHASSLREVFDDPEGLQRVNRLTDPLLRSRARHVVTEMSRVRLVSAELSGTAPAHERFVNVGKALYRSHASLEVDFDASTPALNLAVDTAFAAGALGARIVGAGFGGSVIALVRTADTDATARKIDSTFVKKGFARPTFLTV